MGNGLGSGLLTWLVVAFIGLAVFNLIRSRMRISSPMNYHRDGVNPLSNAAPQFNSGLRQAYTNDIPHQPIGFDTDAFLREAKVQFIRLQAAYDEKNLGDLRQFTTPEVFAEIQLQLQERGNENNQTEVVTLDAKLYDTATESSASVHFSGLIREKVNERPEPFAEIWQFQKSFVNSQWVVAGISQQ
jgi:predicted lipid-binding transport protein (Tim44 family)